MRHRGHGRAAFTLVEIMVVILIITILVGILIPVVTSVRRRVLFTSIALEVRNLNDAIESYKNKYKDYPPDFTDSSVVARHIAKAFPRIAPPGIPPLGEPRPGMGQGWGLDQAEALVFWLGGLSDDPKHPFTGPGGPLKHVGNGQYVANTDRANAFFEFNQKRLTYQLLQNGQYASRDELDLHNMADPNPIQQLYTTPDQFPVYTQKYSDLPFTYHDARSYVVINRGAGTVVYPGYTALGDTTGDVGVARPYKSTERNPDFNAQTDAPDMAVHFMNRRTFQIIAPGLDNSYGWDALAPVDSPAFGQVPCPVFKVFNTGEYFHPSGNAAVPTNYFNSHRDNLTNFSEGRTLEDSKP